MAWKTLVPPASASSPKNSVPSLERAGDEDTHCVALKAHSASPVVSLTA